MSRGPGRVMRAIDAELPAYSASRGLASRALAWRVYGRKPTDREVALIDRAAQRLVEHDLADSTITAEGLRVYFRADGVPAPDNAAESSHAEDDGVVILERSTQMGRLWVEAERTPGRARGL